MSLIHERYTSETVNISTIWMNQVDETDENFVFWKFLSDILPDVQLYTATIDILMKKSWLNDSFNVWWSAMICWNLYWWNELHSNSFLRNGDLELETIKKKSVMDFDIFWFQQHQNNSVYVWMSRWIFDILKQFAFTWLHLWNPPTCKYLGLNFAINAWSVKNHNGKSCIKRHPKS